ncbi:MCM-domain-containing protein [Saitoella complicata NRRL Y-17804]|nr:MCM-domain-containing protein [Saitoella complicata NRRL Y-17804]ODQ55202.1 MCM-domain-containing protein [Saitoella complicata NRRL Y-17804]
MASGPPTIGINVNYDDYLTRITSFLQDFKTKQVMTTADGAEEDLPDDFDDDMDLDGEDAPAQPRGTHQKYMSMLQEISNRARDTVTIDLDDLQAYEHPQRDLLNSILNNTKRYNELISRAIDGILPRPSEDISSRENVLDVIQSQRESRNQVNAEAAQSDTVGSGNEGQFPPELLRRYTLYINPPTRTKSLAVREVRGEHLGHLITVRGIVTRVSDVKPSLQVNAYTCDSCGSEVFQQVKGKQVTPLTTCPSDDCKRNDAKGQLYMSTRASKFSAFQEVKVQEMTDQVPVGHIPRQLTVSLYGPLTRSCSPGDVVEIAGVFLPTPYTGFKAIRAGLLTDTYLEAQHVKQLKKQYTSLINNAETTARIMEMQRSGGVYERMAASIAPEIWGHEDVKKALLLLLIGGVTKEMGDGMKIRGDINVCLMGDPGVAKSQLLKFISKVAPRSVYTTGRGSSGVGLTAAVMRDPVTDEMVLEGGALVLADQGICCIDEFDKMDDGDRTAIHEVMEQQTISISKAGITTTLNARTSILAAANPAYGRYNPRVSPLENINLPAALLSRFDVLFLILDTPARDDDERLAQHVAYVHMHNKHPTTNEEALDPATIRQFVAMARTYRPVVSKEVGEYVVGTYTRLRQDRKRDEIGRGSSGHFAHTSPRTLLGIVRLSQALARLRFSDVVIQEDVDEALRLLESSKSTLMAGRGDDDRVDTTVNSKIYKIIRDLANAGEVFKHDWELATLKRRVISKGFTEDQFKECVKEYEELGVWQAVEEGEGLVFLDGME